jgi:hypothetical protein
MTATTSHTTGSRRIRPGLAIPTATLLIPAALLRGSRTSVFPYLDRPFASAFGQQ